MEFDRLLVLQIFDRFPEVLCLSSFTFRLFQPRKEDATELTAWNSRPGAEVTWSPIHAHTEVLFLVVLLEFR